MTIRVPKMHPLKCLFPTMKVQIAFFTNLHDVCALIFLLSQLMIYEDPYTISETL